MKRKGGGSPPRAPSPKRGAYQAPANLPPRAPANPPPPPANQQQPLPANPPPPSPNENLEDIWWGLNVLAETAAQDARVLGELMNEGMDDGENEGGEDEEEEDSDSDYDPANDPDNEDYEARLHHDEEFYIRLCSKWGCCSFSMSNLYGGVLCGICLTSLFMAALTSFPTALSLEYAEIHRDTCRLKTS